MVDRVEVKLEGVEEFIEALKALPGVLRGRVIGGALRDGARIIQRLAKSSAPVLKGRAKYRTPGTLRDNIVVRTSKIARQRGEVGVFVGVRPLRGKARVAKFGKAGAQNPNDPYYWWWQEFGWVPTGPVRLRGGKARRKLGREAAQLSRARVPGKRFLSGAAQAGGQQAIEQATRRIVPQIERLTVSRIKRLERSTGTVS